MDSAYRAMVSLFQRLGLPTEPEEIDEFIAHHRGLLDDVSLEAAPFWNEHQAAIIRDARQNGSGWRDAVNQLDIRLRYEC